MTDSLTASPLPGNADLTLPAGRKTGARGSIGMYCCGKHGDWTDGMGETKALLRALAGETLPVPPIWLMRQAGRYLPEYRATRAKAGDFLALCYTPELAAEASLQPIRRYDFDGAIVFADILLIAQALGAELRFEEGEGPKLSTTTTAEEVEALKPADAVHERLAPVYETLRILAGELPANTALIGFAGAPWTVATYMIGGRGTPDQAPAHRLREEDPETFGALMAKLTAATTEYLTAQIHAGAETIMLFDSWAGSLKGEAFIDHALKPVRDIISGLKARHPEVPIIVFPRGAGRGYVGFAKATGADCVALDTSVDTHWAATAVQRDGPVQGNLDPGIVASGGQPMIDEAKRIVRDFSGGPHIFNLGHGITPDADPDHVRALLETVRGR